MSMPMTFAMQQAIKSGFAVILLAEIEHPNGTARLWSGVGSLEYDGQTWRGAGVLGSVTPIMHTSSMQVQEIQFSVAGVDTETLAGLNDDVRNRYGRVWLACLDDEGNVVSDPMMIVDSQLDFQSCKVGDDGMNVISITARTGFYTLERALDDRWTAEDHKTRYPDDSGLDLISKLQNQDLVWGP